MEASVPLAEERETPEECLSPAGELVPANVLPSQEESTATPVDELTQSGFRRATKEEMAALKKEPAVKAVIGALGFEPYDGVIPLTPPSQTP